MKYLVVTSITGDKDILVDPKVIFSNCLYLAFVDKVNHNLNVWNQVKNHDFSNIGPLKHRRNAKAEKLLCILPGCSDNTACNFDTTGLCSNLIFCLYPGCSDDSTACNYDPRIS